MLNEWLFLLVFGSHGLGYRKELTTLTLKNSSIKALELSRWDWIQNPVSYTKGNPLSFFSDEVERNLGSVCFVCSTWTWN